MEREIIESLDYSHPWVTAKEHILQVYEEALKHKGGYALDVGCFQGHSALAMGLAGMQVCLVDIEELFLDRCEHLLETHKCLWYGSIVSDSATALHVASTPFDLVMHDAQHGEQVVLELLEYWNKAVKNGGTFIVHDTDQINLANLILQMGNPETKTTADERGRQLTIFYKP